MTLDPKPSTIDSVDPTRLTVSDDGRTVYLDSKPLVWGCEQKLPRGTWDSMEALSYLQYALNALAAHGSDFSYLRDDCEKPFVGRVMERKSHRIGWQQVVIAYRYANGNLLVVHNDGFGLAGENELRPLPPPKERRPMTWVEFVRLAGEHRHIAKNDSGTLWRIEELSFKWKYVLLARDVCGGRIETKKTLAQLAAEGWRCGGQLLSVEE